MVSPALIDWVKRQEVKGYNSQQIYLHLVNNGYDQKDVIEAINYSNSVSGNYPGNMQYGNNQYNAQFQNPYQNQNMNKDNYHNSSNKNSSSNNSSGYGMWIFLAIIIVLGVVGFYLYSSGMYVSLLETASSKLGLSSSNSNVEETTNTIESESVDSSDNQIVVVDSNSPDYPDLNGASSSQQDVTSEIDPAGIYIDSEEPLDENADPGEPEIIYEEAAYDEEIIVD